MTSGAPISGSDGGRLHERRRRRTPRAAPAVASPQPPTSGATMPIDGRRGLAHGDLLAAMLRIAERREIGVERRPVEGAGRGADGAVDAPAASRPRAPRRGSDTARRCSSAPTITSGLQPPALADRHDQRPQHEAAGDHDRKARQRHRDRDAGVQQVGEEEACRRRPAPATGWRSGVDAVDRVVAEEGHVRGSPAGSGRVGSPQREARAGRRTAALAR